MQSTLWVLSGGRRVGREGLGQVLSSLFVSWPGGSLPLPLDRGAGDSGVSTSGLVNIYDVCLFFKLCRGDSGSLQQNRSPVSPRNTCHILPLPLLLRSLQGLPHPGQSPTWPYVPFPGTNCSCLRWAQQRAPQLPNRKEDPTLLSSPLSPSLRLLGGGGALCRSAPPSAAEE